MVVHWETSLKPLYVRTVWIDGRRHAILSKDDPAANAVCPIVTSPPNRTPRNSSPELSPSSTPTNAADLTLNAYPLNLANTYKQNASCKQDVFKIERNCTTASKPDENIYEKNPLSERVLQWLDLAGRENLNLGIEELKTPETTYNVPEVKRDVIELYSQGNGNKTKRIQRRSSKTSLYKNSSESSEDQYEPYSRTYFQAPLESNNMQNYIKQTYNNFGSNSDSFYPLRTHIHSNMITFQENTPDIKSEGETNQNRPKNNDRKISTPQTDRFKSYSDGNEYNVVLKKQSNTVSGYFESHYIDLVRRRMSEAHYAKDARRQLHIFIPSLPKQVCDSKTSSLLGIEDNLEN